MGEKSATPTSGIWVMISVTLAGMIGQIALPWTNYQTTVWSQQYPGIEFGADYGKLMATLLTLLFQIGVGIAHIGVIAWYRNYPAEGLFRYFFPKKDAKEPQWLEQLRQLHQNEHDVTVHEATPAPPKTGVIFTGETPK